MKKKKIGFYWIHLLSQRNEEEIFNNVGCSIPPLLNYICSLPKIERKYNLTNEKFCFIENFKYDENAQVIELLFKSAKHSYRAPLLDKNTVEARDNPKRIEEGEQIKTHILMKFKENDAIAFLETGLNNMTMANIIEYLNNFIMPYNNSAENDIIGLFTSDMIPREDFREVLDNMSRVLCADIFINKSLLGSEALNFSDITDDVQENIVLSLKSEKKKSIKSTIYECVNKLNGVQYKINRIRVKGILPNDNDSIIDTSFIIKKEYVEVEQNEDTGEFDTANMFAQLRFLSNDY